MLLSRKLSLCNIYMYLLSCIAWLLEILGQAELKSYLFDCKIVGRGEDYWMDLKFLNRVRFRFRCLCIRVIYNAYVTFFGNLILYKYSVQ